MCVNRTRRFRFVDVLTTGTARPHDVGTNVILVNVDLDAVIDHRENHDTGKGSVPPCIGIERRDTDQTMHAILALEPAISIVALDHDGRRFDSGALPLALLDPVDLVTVLLRPAHIHAHEHAGPVLALGAAGPGVHFEIAIVGIGLAR